MRPDLPQGRLALVFTDIEGSTRLLQALGPQYPAQLAAHRRILRACFAAHCGVEVDTQGDSFFAVFGAVRDAIAAVVQAQRELHAFDWPVGFPLRVRIGLHCGEPEPTGEGYVGLDLHRCARLMGSGHGGQILLSGEAAHEAAQEAGARMNGAELRDMGEHHLKGLPHPERIFELRVNGLCADFPPLRTIDNRPHNLPALGSPIVGREREIADLRAQLQAGANLITLLGPGGTGKTRLALAVAAATRDLWPDGVFFVPLAPIAAPTKEDLANNDLACNNAIEDSIADAVARALGLRDDGSQTVAQRLPLHLKERKMLLVLDNFEHLVSGAKVVAKWRECCPHLAILATSRIPLHLRGERQFPVMPLALPECETSQDRRTRHKRRTRHELPALSERRTMHKRRTIFGVTTLARFSALALFAERARAVKPDFALTEANVAAIIEICARLDGLPLAIELAAARIKLLSPAALLGRLDNSLTFLTGGVRDGLGHHQTLRAAIGWSYDLLDDDGKRLFRRLSVFRGGFDLEGAEQVCAAPVGAESRADALDVFEGVASLLDQSLLMRRDKTEGEPRFLMLETIRQFALEKLDESGESAAIHERHLRWCQGATDARNAEMRGDFGRALRLFRDETDNWRSAWNWSLGAHPDAALQLAATAALLWNRAGNTSENYQRLESSLRAAPDGEAKYRGRALQYLIQTDRNRADWERYSAHLRQLEALAQQADLPEFAAIALDQRMWDAVGSKEAAKALEQGETILLLRRECVERARLERLDAAEIARCEDELLDAMILHVEVLFGAGEMEAAWPLMETSLTAKRTSGDAGGLNLALCKYAQLLALDGRHDEARAVAEELVRRVQALGDRSLSLAFYLHDAAEIVLQQGDLARARELLSASYAVCKENVSAMGFLLILRDLTALHAQTGHWDLFARLMGAMDITGDWNSSTLADASELPPDANECAARAALGHEEFEAQRIVGMRMGPHPTIEAALQDQWLPQTGRQNFKSDVRRNEARKSDFRKSDFRSSDANSSAT